MFPLKFAEYLAENEEQKKALEKIALGLSEGHLVVETEAPPLPDFIYSQGNLHTLRSLYDLQVIFTKNVERLLHTKPKLDVSSKSSKKLTEGQNRIIENALKGSLGIISGGPGTGKTHTASELLGQFPGTISLAAPTGKAASRLHPDATTLHTLLNGPPILPADLVLVDEASMIDVHLMAELFERIKPGGRLILVGDSHQLPPVEAGSLFSDLIEHLQVEELTECLRTEYRELVTFAAKVKEGLLTPDFRFDGDPLQLIDAHFSKPVKLEPDAIRAHLMEWGLLTPFRREVEKFNGALNHTHQPIIITKNTPDLNLYNGDTGLLVDQKIAYFPQQETLLKLPRPLLPPHSLAYAYSIHKSQGSEFNNVILSLPKGSEKFGRELFYTGITRAKQSLRILSDEETLQALVAKTSKRRSLFQLLWRL